jgi:hypothetical protein
MEKYVQKKKEVKAMIENGKITRLAEIFECLGMEQLAAALELQPEDIAVLLKDVQKFEVGHVMTIQQHLDVDIDFVSKIVFNELRQLKANTLKKVIGADQEGKHQVTGKHQNRQGLGQTGEG